MNVKQIQNLVDEYFYWDMRVESLENRYFGDEIELIYDDTKGFQINYLFTGCYKLIFERDKSYPKLQEVKTMDFSQKPYFQQEVEIGDVVENDLHLYTCKIKMYPLEVEIWCNKIEIKKNPIRKK